MLSEHKSVPNAPATGGKLRAVAQAVVSGNVAGCNDVIVVHTNNLQFCFNICLHNHNHFKRLHIVRELFYLGTYSIVDYAVLLDEELAVLHKLNCVVNILNIVDVGCAVEDVESSRSRTLS